MNIIEDTYQKLTELNERGDVRVARELLAERFLSFPEELQGKILTNVLMDAVDEEIESLRTKRALQEVSLDLLEVLETLKDASRDEAD